MKTTNNLLGLKRYRGYLYAVAPWLLLIGIWQIMSVLGWLNSAFIPTPSELLRELTRTELYGVVIVDAAYTITRMFTTIIIAYGIVIFLVWLTYRYTVVDTFTSQLKSLFKFLPPPVLIPIAILAVGINNSSILVVGVVVATLLLLNYVFSIKQKEIESYRSVIDSWQLKQTDQFRFFFLPIAHYLSYRFIATLIIWLLSVTIFCEIVIGSEFGFGTRLVQLQQLYQPAKLFALIIGILVSAFASERLIVNSLSRFRMDAVRSISSIVLALVLIFSLGFQSFLFIKTNPASSRLTIATYTATVNLPLFVMHEKFNELNTNLTITGSGLQTIDAVAANQAVAAGYGDIPNVLAAMSKNSDLKMLSQAEETQEQPLLFLVTTREVGIGSYKNLSGAKIGYYPNNPIIQTGIDLTLLMGGASVGGIEYISGNDPAVLSQSFVSGQLDALVSIEPYITSAEKQTSVTRINPNKTLISGISFESLPLAGLVINTQTLGDERSKTLSKALIDSLRFIRDHTQNNQATGELRDIMTKYGLDPDSTIPVFSESSSVDSKGIDQILSLIRVYDPQIAAQLNNLNAETLYYK